jgi:hypothetical protein
LRKLGELESLKLREENSLSLAGSELNKRRKRREEKRRRGLLFPRVI